MKAIKQYILAALLAATTGSVMAQDMNSAYFLDGFSYRHDMNPAYGNELGYCAIPVLGNLNVQMRGSLGLEDVFFKNPDFGVKPGAKKTATFLHPGISVDKALSGFDKDRNTLLFNMDIPIASVGFFAFDGYNTVELRERVAAGFSAPYEFFEFAKDTRNKDYSFEDIGAFGRAYTELALGHSRQIFDNLRVGAKVKFLFGNAYADLKMENMHASLQGDHWVVEGKARGELNMKGAKFKEKTEEYKSRPGQTYTRVSGIDTDGAGAITGFGLGLDLGAVYEFKDCSLDWLNGLKASWALTDLGFISYSNMIVAESSGKPFTFDGFNNIAMKDEGTLGGQSFSQQGDDLKDRLTDFANLENKPDEAGGSKTHGLGATMRFGLEYPLPVYDRLKFGLLYTHRYGGDLYHWSEGRLSANIAPLDWVDGGINVGISSFHTEMGWVVNFHPTGCNVFLGMDYMMGNTGKSLIPMDSNVCFNFGVNITFGDKSRRKLKERQLEVLTF